MSPAPTSPEEARKQWIRRIVRQRDINCVVHFTPVENLDNILKYGLLSRKELEARSLRARIVDPLRLDDRPDRISLSISFPNDRMFFKKRNELRDVAEWVVLAFGPALLSELDCLFSPGNAARKDIGRRTDDELRSPDAFAAMFAGERHPRLPPSYTTDPQAEVLVRDRVPREYLSAVIVYNRADPPRIRKRLDSVGLPKVGAECDKSMFAARCDTRRSRPAARPAA